MRCIAVAKEALRKLAAPVPYLTRASEPKSHIAFSFELILVLKVIGREVEEDPAPMFNRSNKFLILLVGDLDFVARKALELCQHLREYLDVKARVFL